jgi:hypothetical protein
MIFFFFFGYLSLLLHTGPVLFCCAQIKLLTARRYKQGFPLPLNSIFTCYELRAISLVL